MRAALQVRRRHRGQVLVETALVMPLTVFLVLGLLQLFKAYEARFLAEYAAFRATRAGAVGRGDCEKMTAAALQALLPSLARTDTPAMLKKAWQGAESNLYQQHWAIQGRPPAGGNPAIVELRVRGQDLPTDANYQFDTLVEGVNRVHHVTVQLTYWYELRIPFANRIIHQAWQLTSYGSEVDLLMSWRSDPNANQAPQREQANDVITAATSGTPAFLLPIRTTWSMRLMSNLRLDSFQGNACQLVL